MKTVITKEILENLLEQGLSSNQIGKQLGYSGVGIRYYMKNMHQQQIKNSISSFGDDIERSRKRFALDNDSL